MTRTLRDLMDYLGTLSSETLDKPLNCFPYDGEAYFCDTFKVWEPKDGSVTLCYLENPVLGPELPPKGFIDIHGKPYGYPTKD